MRGIIIGGGIGGLTTAIALKQKGISVTVYEAAPELKAVGSGIIMATNAMQVLQRLGLANRIKEKGYKLTSGQIADEQWRTLQVIDGQYAINKYGVGSYAIHRASLQQILFDELPEGIVKLNHKVVSILQIENKVQVNFENGSEAEADFVIGADGIKSVVRQSLFGNTNYRYSGQTCWRATVNMPIPKKMESVAYELWGTKAGLRLGMVPVNQNEVYYYATRCAPAGGKDELNTVKENLSKQYSEFGENSISIFCSF
jgi:2-polyprenyl-6-methoxyphenol hydroxylase-like FAD-dependent oxidoreductase